MSQLLLTIVLLSFLSFNFIAFGEFKFSRKAVLSVEKLSDTFCLEGFCGLRSKRYILYEVNPGEGFNLRRDIFLRIAPLIHILNKNDSGNWVLVLPPWSSPHWRNTKGYLDWKTFFDVNKIQEHVASIEFSQFLDEYGVDNSLDSVYQLQNFPFEAKESWEEKIEIVSNCERPLVFKKKQNESVYVGNFWNHSLISKQASCVALRGGATTLAKLLINKNLRTVMINRAEVILWNSMYGSHDWWTVRKALVFSSKLVEYAKLFLQRNMEAFRSSEGPCEEGQIPFLAFHLRRGDFLRSRISNLPTIKEAVNQILKKADLFKTYIIFLATDGSQKEISELMKLLKENRDTEINVVQFPCQNTELSEGECAIVDQILCSWANYFMGTAESTFTLRIFEERELLHKSPESTFNYFCVNNHNCKEATKWRLQ